jgi:hypothetical protein
MPNTKSQLSLWGENLNLKAPPVAEKLSKQEAQHALLLFCRKGNGLPCLALDLVFIAGFKTHPLRHLIELSNPKFAVLRK